LDDLRSTDDHGVLPPGLLRRRGPVDATDPEIRPVFRLDNPLVDFGNAVYQPNEPINLCYDSFGAPAALVRGLFEYVYRADGLTLIPHIPPRIRRLQQDFPIRFGRKQIYLATVGSGPIAAVTLNGKPWQRFGPRTVDLIYDEIPDESVIVLALGSTRRWWR